MNIRPIGNRILVQQKPREEITASGIILPANTEKEKKNIGNIMALGDGPEIQRLGLKIGDTVVFSRYAGEEIEMDKEEFTIVNVGSEKDESGVFAVID